MPAEPIKFNEKEMFLDSNAVNVFNTARCDGHYIGESETLTFFAILSKTYDHNVTNADLTDFYSTIVVPFYDYLEKALKSRHVAICISNVVIDGDNQSLVIEQMPVINIKWALFNGQKIPDGIFTLLEKDIFQISDNFTPNDKPNTLCFGFNLA